MLSGEYKEDVKLLLSLVPVWAKKPSTEGMMPSFYGTGEYTTDMEIIEKVEKIQKKIDGMKVFEDKCPHCGNEDIEHGDRDMDRDYYGCYKCGSCITVWDDGEYDVQLDCIDPMELRDED